MIWICIIITTLYTVLILLLQYGYHKVAPFLLRKEAATIQFSVVVVFRNEAENLPALLTSLQQLAYPKTHFEVLFVNDVSEDISEAIIQQTLEKTTISYKILQNTPTQLSPKKTGIALAISEAQHEWILTTDADCVVPSHWLRAFNNYIATTAPICVAAPVTYQANTTYIQRYQQLDNWSLQAVTVGSFGLATLLLSNGANFAYQKDAFNQVNGFEGNMHVASGDDIFLLEKFQERFPKRIGYLKSKDAMVTTRPVITWKALLSQRLRWASKTSKQKSIAVKCVGGIVFLVACMVCLFPLALLVVGDLWWGVILLLIIKMLVDGFFIASSATFFGKKIPFLSFFISFFLNAFITVYVVISSLFGTYTWKQRTFKR